MARGKGKPFQKGNTFGKLGGRPRLPENMKLLRSMSAQELAEFMTKMKDLSYKQLEDLVNLGDITVFEKAVAQAFMDASNGNLSALTILMDRMVGRVPEQIQVSGVNGGPIEVKHLSDSEVERQLAEFEKKK